MSKALQDLERLLSDGWQPISPPRAYAFGGQNDIRAVQIRLALAQEPPIPLFEALKRLLLQEWDPLEIKRSPAAEGEYNGYAFRIWIALGRGASAGQIEAYLNGVATADMRAEIAPGLNRAVAKKAAALVSAMPND